MLDLDFPSAEIVAHSRTPKGVELITMEVELHRFILPEFNTHRTFSRNFQSSRAVPTESMIKQVMENPAMPVHWGKNQKGMVAEKELDDLKKDGAITHWEIAAQNAAFVAESMRGLGVHKQVVNRLLEPFMKTKGIVTATLKDFQGFFKLRCHKDAQPEIKLLAERMRDAIANSEPVQLNYGEYHLPYVKEYSNLEEAIKVSCSCAAQVSYRKLDESLEKAMDVYDKLNLPEGGIYSEDPPHFSPTEHVVKIVNLPNTYLSGNFNSTELLQYRKALELGLDKEFVNE